INAPLPVSIETDIETAYHMLIKNPGYSVAVRSSATTEDSVEASFAGQQETLLNVSGVKNVLSAVKRVYASLFTERAISYRVDRGFRHDDVAISVGIQQMIRSDQGCSGVLF